MLAGEADQPGGLGDGELDRADAGRAWLSGPGGDGRVAEGDAQVSADGLLLLLLILLGAGRGREGDVAAQGVADGGMTELGEGGQGVCRQIASQVRTWDWSQPSVSFPVLNVSSQAQRRPAMVMKNVIVAGWPSGDQHR